MAVLEVLAIDLSNNTPEFAMGQLIAHMVYPGPDARREVRAREVEFALLLQKEKLEGDLLPEFRQRLVELSRGHKPGRPFRVRADEAVCKRLAAAHHTMGLIVQHTEFALGLPKGMKRFSLQACLRNLCAEFGVYDEREAKRTYWEPSFRVLHMAAALNVMNQNAQRAGLLDVMDHPYFNDPDFVREWVARSAVLERFVAERWPAVSTRRGQVHIELV